MAMCNGIALFIVLYSVADYKTQHSEFRNSPLIHSTLVIGFVTRCLLSFLYWVPLFDIPFVFIDLMLGSVSVHLMHLDESNNSYYAVLATTIFQGILLNLVLLLYMIIVLLLQIVVVKVTGKSH